MTEARHPDRVQQGRGGARPARGQHPLRPTSSSRPTGACIFKHGAKEIAYLNGYGITFMAKPDHTWTGSSGHLHMILWDADGDEGAASTRPAAQPYGMSQTMRQFLGGMMKLCARAGHLHRPEHQLLQALRRRCRGRRSTWSGAATTGRPASGSSGDGAGAPHREPLPGRRHERLPDLRGRRRRRAVRHRAQDRAAGRVQGQRLRGHRLRPDAARAVRGDRRSWSRARPRSRSSGRTSSTTTSTPRASSSETYDAVVHAWERERYLERG